MSRPLPANPSLQFLKEQAKRLLRTMPHRKLSDAQHTLSLEYGFLDTDNFRKRVLHHLAHDLKLPKLTFQVIRRTIATLSHKKNTVKDVQRLMRHSRTATTTDVDVQEIPESVQSTVNSINMELRQTPAKEHRKAAKVLLAASGAGRSKSNRGAVSTKVFGNLTPNDTKRSQREAARVR